MGREDLPGEWYSIDARTGRKSLYWPAPEHLFITAETKEEAMVMIAKLCMRPTTHGKDAQEKLSHWIDLHKRYYGTMPEGIEKFVRTAADIPITMKDEIIKMLEAKGWKKH